MGRGTKVERLCIVPHRRHRGAQKSNVYFVEMKLSQFARYELFYLCYYYCFDYILLINGVQLNAVRAIAFSCDFVQHVYTACLYDTCIQLPCTLSVYSLYNICTQLVCIIRIRIEVVQFRSCTTRRHDFL